MTWEGKLDDKGFWGEEEEAENVERSRA
jgi:hypothetical protein